MIGKYTEVNSSVRGVSRLTWADKESSGLLCTDIDNQMVNREGTKLLIHGKSDSEDENQ